MIDGRLGIAEIGGRPVESNRFATCNVEYKQNEINRFDVATASKLHKTTIHDM